MMEKKPDLIVKLFAGDALVDQSTDPGLWQRVLAEIRGIAPPPATDKRKDGTSEEEESTKRQNTGSPIKAFAKEIDVTVGDLEGGLDPRTEAPFISLDSRSWETLKRNTPKKGPGGVSPAVLAATALVLWQRHGNTPDVTLQTVRATLDTIHLEDPNGARSIGNCDWLQVRGSRVLHHPSQISGGIRLLKAYCKREPLPDAG